VKILIFNVSSGEYVVLPPTSGEGRNTPGHFSKALSSGGIVLPPTSGLGAFGVFFIIFGLFLEYKRNALW
jgi:hypothetical protein